jgi:hypothetical protein
MPGRALSPVFTPGLTLALGWWLALMLLSGCASTPPDAGPTAPDPEPSVAEPQHLPSARSRSLRIDLGSQTFRYVEDGRLVRSGPVSAGSAQHPTPTGRFKVLNKEKDKVSRSYTNAFDMPTPMPYALQFSGPYYVHEGWLPGYHDSHGCVRLHYEDARFVYERIRRGDPILITGSEGTRHTAPATSPAKNTATAAASATDTDARDTTGTPVHVIRAGRRQQGEWLSLDDPRRRW